LAGTASRAALTVGLRTPDSVQVLQASFSMIRLMSPEASPSTVSGNVNPNGFEVSPFPGRPGPAATGVVGSEDPDPCDP
jgi:hypothetical protein